MQIGETIRKYRKITNMTQEEMARRLGVTAPAVNKWENGNSMPDITLLAPIARLLNISLDTLLSFQDELSSEEIKRLIAEADQQLKNKSYEAAFQWAKAIAAEYPNCTEFILQLAVLFDANRLFDDVPDAETYDACIHDWYIRALQSEREHTKTRAADALFGFYFRKEQFGKAEECLSYFSTQNPERKRKLAELYWKTGRVEEAYQALEELVFSDYQMICMTLQNLYMLAMQEPDLKKAHLITDKQTQLAAVFDMGKYYETSGRLELATYEQDADAVIDIMREMLANVDHVLDFTHSPLYEHMKFSESCGEFSKELRENLLACFRDEETYSFLQNDPRWKALVKEF